MPTKTAPDTRPAMKYLDMQAYVGITKHNGGMEATDELLALCGVREAKNVLNVGCGIGAGSVHIARAFGCHVVGVDLSEKMIGWSRLRAKEGGVLDRVEFGVANVLDLPFPADCFDVVVAESVLAFVRDRSCAVRECVRVTRPGGYVGLNEAFYLQAPPSETTALVNSLVDTVIPTLDEWQVIWEQSGLQDRVIHPHQVKAGDELRSRLKWVGGRWMLRAWGRLFHLILTRPGDRQSIRRFFSADAIDSMTDTGYGIFVGRK